MGTVAWLVILGSVGGIAFLCWRALSKWQARKRSEEERFSAFMGVLKSTETPAAASPPASTLPLEKLLFEAATKAGEAGEPAIAIQLYERLLARYPATPFATQTRAAVEAQKKRLKA